MSAFTVLTPSVKPVRPIPIDSFEAPTAGRADRAMTLIVMLSQGTRVLGECTLGLVGWDNTSRDLALRASQGFGMSVLVFLPSKLPTPTDLPQGVSRAEGLQEVLHVSDFVSVHGPHSKGAPAVMTAERMTMMKEDACLINVCAAGLVNELALTQALWFDTIGGAGFDLTDRACAPSVNLTECDRFMSVSTEANPSKIHFLPTRG